MDASIAAAAQALAQGDPLAALQRIALRDDATGLALRGIASAQLGDFVRAKVLLRRAMDSFGVRAVVPRARCAVALAEVALAARELTFPVRALQNAVSALSAHGDEQNALHGQLVLIRHRLLVGRVDDAAQALADLNLKRAPPRLLAIAQLARANAELRAGRALAAQRALQRAELAAARAGIPALEREIAAAQVSLAAPTARLVSHGTARLLDAFELERSSASSALTIDARTRTIRRGTKTVRLATRPTLFALARALGEQWPADASRAALIAQVFGVARPNESHRARLRVEIARLRRELRPVAQLRATPAGFALESASGSKVVVLLPLADDGNAALLALLSDGQAWSTSALAVALGTSRRTIQRALGALAASGTVRGFGRARARRWLLTPWGELAPAQTAPFAAVVR